MFSPYVITKVSSWDKPISFPQPSVTFFLDICLDQHLFIYFIGILIIYHFVADTLADMEHQTTENMAKIWILNH